jgi:FdhD protein
MNATGARATSRVAVTRVLGGERRPRERDLVAAEEPMEIRLLAGSGAAAGVVPGTRADRVSAPRTPSNRGDARRDAVGGAAATGTDKLTVAVTMRTPGRDFELAAGFLFSEGILHSRDEIHSLHYCLDESEPERHNIVNVALRSSSLPAVERLERHFTMSSACGVCGKAHLEALEVRCPAPGGAGPRITAAVLETLPEKLRSSQALFGRTGGLHAAGLFTATGELLAVREDVGRHNALDKLIGWALLEDTLPLDELVICVSGRASFELLQKSVVAGARVIAAVSAPSSLAVDVAERFGVTLVGFLRDERFNVYTGGERVTSGTQARRARAGIGGALESR